MSNRRLSSPHSLAEAGLPVFPCRSDKSPLTPNGFHDATTDPNLIGRWLDIWPDALWAVPTGQRSHLYVVDADVDKVTGDPIGETSLAPLGIAAETHPHWVKTQSGGMHFIYRWTEGLRNTTKRIPGVDTRGEGGYVVAWNPEALIAAYIDENLVSPPEAVIAALKKPTETSANSGGAQQSTVNGLHHAEKWASTALDREVAALRTAKKGNRNAEINRCAFQLGQIVGAGYLDRTLVESEIWEAAVVNGKAIENPEGTRATIRSGLEAGLKQPRGPAASAMHGGAKQSAHRSAGLGEPPRWEEVVPVDIGDLPRLTSEMVGGIVGEYSAALARFTETPFELAFTLVMGAIATAAARRVRVLVKPDYYEPTNIWLLATLPSGNRKSPVERVAAAPLREWERDRAETLVPEIAKASAEAKAVFARAKELHEKAAKANTEEEGLELAHRASEIEQLAPKIPKPPRLWTSDATPENLGTLLSDNGGCMGWLSSEATMFEILAGRYSRGQPNLELMLKAHSGDPERIDRIGRPSVYLQQPLLTVAMSPQPEHVRGLMAKPGFRGRGLLARFLYFLPPSPLGWRTHDGPPISKEIKAGYRAMLRAMLEWPVASGGEEQFHTLTLSADARTQFDVFANEIEVRMRPGADLEDAKDWAGKAPGAAVRLAGILHSAQLAHENPWQTAIHADTMMRAIAIIRVSAQHMLAAFTLMAADRQLAAANRLWTWILNERRKNFRARDAWQALKGSGLFQRMADLMAALSVLEERGYVQIVTEPSTSPGRAPSPTIVVSPDFARPWS